MNYEPFLRTETPAGRDGMREKPNNLFIIYQPTSLARSNVSEDNLAAVRSIKGIRKLPQPYGVQGLCKFVLQQKF